MANAYTIRCVSIVSDGTNYYLEVEVNTGSQTLPLLRPVFPVGTTYATMLAYLQNIANNQPTLASDLPNLVNLVIRGA